MGAVYFMFEWKMLSTVITVCFSNIEIKELLKLLGAEWGTKIHQENSDRTSPAPAQHWTSTGSAPAQHRHSTGPASAQHFCASPSSLCFFFSFLFLPSTCETRTNHTNPSTVRNPVLFPELARYLSDMCHYRVIPLEEGRLIYPPTFL